MTSNFHIQFKVTARGDKVHRLDLDRETSATIYRAGREGVRLSLEALRLFLDRRDRKSHPAGVFDSAGVWYPDAAENIDGYIDTIEPPTPAHPFTYLRAAIDMGHCARLMRADIDVVLACRRAGCDGNESVGELMRKLVQGIKQACRETAPMAA